MLFAGFGELLAAHHDQARRTMSTFYWLTHRVDLFSCKIAYCKYCLAIFVRLMEVNFLFGCPYMYDNIHGVLGPLMKK